MAMDRRKGRSMAYVDLVNMDSDILGLMKNPFPVVVGIGIFIQLVLTILMIRYSQGTLYPPAMDATEPGIVFRNLLVEHPAQRIPRRSTANLNRTSSTMEEGASSMLIDRDLARDDEGPVVVPAASVNSTSSLLQENYEMDDFPPRDSGRIGTHGT